MSFVPEQLDLTIVYEPGEDGWIIASIPEVRGVHSQGRSRDEARALRVMLAPSPSADYDRREHEALHLTIGISRDISFARAVFCSTRVAITHGGESVWGVVRPPAPS